MIGGGNQKGGHGVGSKRMDLIQGPRNVQVQIEIHKWGPVVGTGRPVTGLGAKSRWVIGVRLGHIVGKWKRGCGFMDAEISKAQKDEGKWVRGGG